MSQDAFFQAEARTRTTAVVQQIESQTAAEVVVALRKRSGSYRHADYLFGFLIALLTLIAILAVPQPLSPLALPVNALISFALGAAICALLPSLRRALCRRALLRSNVLSAARAAFYELGVSRTSGRWGVLVYLSMLEREVELVPDLAIDPAALGEEWSGTVERMRGAVRRGDLDGFLEAMGGLGPLLGRLHPRREDDVNELSDELSA